MRDEHDLKRVETKLECLRELVTSWRETDKVALDAAKEISETRYQHLRTAVDRLTWIVALGVGGVLLAQWWIGR